MIIISQNQAFLFGIIAYLFILGMALIIGNEKDNIKFNIIKGTMKILFCIYVILLISKVYFPLTIAWGQQVKFIPPVIWLRPLWSFMQVYNQGGIHGVIYQIGGNLILLTPLAFFLCYFNEKRFCSIKKIVTVCFCTTLFIESSQLILSIVVPNTSRYFEINDIINNTLSGVFGYYIYLGYRKVCQPLMHKDEKINRYF